jgi:hypothetical protein
VAAFAQMMGSTRAPAGPFRRLAETWMELTSETLAPHPLA